MTGKLWLDSNHQDGKQAGFRKALSVCMHVYVCEHACGGINGLYICLKP